MTTRTLFDMAELSLAAYSALVKGETRLQTSPLQAEGKGMSSTQATTFAARYPSIITQYDDKRVASGMGTSFSATVFSDAVTGGNLTLAIRTAQVAVSQAPEFNDSAVSQAFFASLGGSVPTGISAVNVADQALIGTTSFGTIAGWRSRPGQPFNIPIDNQSNPDEPALFGARNHTIVTVADPIADYDEAGMGKKCMDGCQRRRLGWSGRGLAKASVIVTLSASLAGCVGWVPGQRVYWDAKVRELCRRDGGVTVYEQVELSRDEFRRLGGGKEGLPIPHARSENSDFPYFFEIIDSKIQESNPVVIRTEMLVKRRADKKLLGRSIQYIRRGGDFPTGLAQDSSFICPDKLELSVQIFRLKRDSK